MNEQQRIKEAQDNFYNWCIKNLPVGRKVTQEDIESIARVRESNLQCKEKLFSMSME